jgi:hypothetical protein
VQKINVLVSSLLLAVAKSGQAFSAGSAKIIGSQKPTADKTFLTENYITSPWVNRQYIHTSRKILVCKQYFWNSLAYFKTFLRKTWPKIRLSRSRWSVWFQVPSMYKMLIFFSPPTFLLVDSDPWTN